MDLCTYLAGMLTGVGLVLLVHAVTSWEQWRAWRK